MEGEGAEEEERRAGLDQKEKVEKDYRENKKGNE